MDKVALKMKKMPPKGRKKAFHMEKKHKRGKKTPKIERNFFSKGRCSLTLALHPPMSERDYKMNNIFVT